MSFLDIYLARFKESHGDRYDYSKVVYVSALKNVEIVCKEHGSFWQLPTNHARGTGCPECAKQTRSESRKLSQPKISDEEKLRRRKEAKLKYASKPEVKIKLKQKRDALRLSGKASEYGKQWYQKNKQKILMRVKEWGEANKHRREQYQRDYRLRVWSKESVHTRVAVATPKWADLSKISDIYAECDRVTKQTGVQHHVDHIEPLRGADRCGLHVAENLRIIPASENLTKGNGGVAPKKKEFLESLTDKEKADYVDVLFDDCRKSGFPYFDVPSPEAVRKSIVTARKYLDGQDIDSDLLATAHGNSIASAFFPHMFSVKMGNMVSPEDVFFDDYLLKKALTKAVHRHDHISDRVIRTAVSLYGGARAVSNFPPLIAAKLYRRFAGEDAVVYDPCGGWGGRMLGAAIAPNVKHYICTEVNSLTVVGLEQLSDLVKGFLNSSVVETPTEEFSELQNIDMVMTSPPYFDHEKYSNDKDQSYLKYPSEDAWLSGFLTPLILNAHKMLKKNGVLALNVANVPTCALLTSHTMRIALENGFSHDVTLPMYVRTTNGKQKEKYEPVFVFRKS